MSQKAPNAHASNVQKTYDFMRFNHTAIFISALLLLISGIAMGIRGFNWGLDFTGGTVIEVSVAEPVELPIVRDQLTEAGMNSFIVQNFGTARDIMIRLPPFAKNESLETLKTEILSVLSLSGANNSIIKRVEFVGPSVGKSLAEDGAVALIAALIAILIYIALRFEWRLACGAVIALGHDVIITLGLLSLLQIEIDLTIIAAILSVIGYSLNDTIVVFDRIRENFRKLEIGTPVEIVNLSLSQTLSRTLITSVTTLLVLFILYFFGGPVLQPFSLTLFIGICIGTASSIYVATAFALKFGIHRDYLLVEKVEKEGADLPE